MVFQAESKLGIRRAGAILLSSRQKTFALISQTVFFQHQCLHVVVSVCSNLAGEPISPTSHFLPFSISSFLEVKRERTFGKALCYCSASVIFVDGTRLPRLRILSFSTFGRDIKSKEINIAMETIISEPDLIMNY